MKPDLPEFDFARETLVDAQGARGLPKLGPGVVYPRVIDNRLRDFDSSAFLGGNFGSREMFGLDEPRFEDLADVAMLADGDFWRLIGGAARAGLSATVRALKSELVAGGPTLIGAFAKALGQHLWELDSPELLEAGVVMPGNVPLRADSGLYLRCAIGLGGRERFERALRDPSDAWRPGETVDAEELLHLGAGP